MRATLRLCRFRPRMASLAFCLLTPARSARSTAVTFAFILGIPAILGGSVLELGDALHSDMELDWVALGIGFVIAAVVGILSIKLVSWLVKKDRYKIFGVYTAVLGAACVAAGLWEHISGNTLHSLIMG